MLAIVAGGVRPHLTPLERKEITVSTELTRSRKILTGANGLTAFRILAALMAADALIRGNFIEAFIWAFLGILSDLFDGMIAKRGLFGGASEIGKIFDPVADKALINIPLITLAIILILTGHVLAGVTLLVALGVVAIREVIVGFTKRDLARYEGLKSAIESARASMGMQSTAFLGIIISAAFGWFEMIPLFSGMIISATVVSGWDYRARLRKLKKALKES